MTLKKTIPSKDTVIIINNGNGTVKTISSIQVPIDDIITNSVPKDKTHRVSTLDKLPDYAFRDQWTDDYDTDTVDIDLEKAKVHVVNCSRVKRDAQWGDFDKRYAVAERDGGNLTELKKEREILKKIPQEVNQKIKLIETPEKLKQFL